MTVNWNNSTIIRRAREAAMRAIVRGTEKVKTEAVSLILNPPKTGRIYTRRGVEHQASAPGEAPASDTGRLANSLITTYDTKNLIGRVNASTEYARPLEYGTVKMEPRPYLRPALANLKAEIEDDIANEIAKAIG